MFAKLFGLKPKERPDHEIHDCELTEVTKQAIPCTVYQTWTNNLFGKTHSESIANWRAKNPDLSFRLFDDTARDTYMKSLALGALVAVRSHWGIENRLHWVLDVVFGDDHCRVRANQAPKNFTVIKHMALNLLNRAKQKNHCASCAKRQAGTINS